MSGSGRARERRIDERFDDLFGHLIDRSPFHPFTVELLSGQRFEVDHPRAMIVRDGVAVFLKPRGIPVWFDHESVGQIVEDIADAPIGRNGDGP